MVGIAQLVKKRFENLCVNLVPVHDRHIYVLNSNLDHNAYFSSLA